MMDVIGTRKYSFTFSGVLFIASILLLMVWGLRFGIDFTGGSLLSVSFADTRPTVEQVQTVLGTLDVGTAIVKPVGEAKMTLQFRFLNEEEHQKIFGALAQAFSSSTAAATTAEAKGVDVIADEGIEVDVSTAAGTGTAPVARVHEEQFETIGPTVSTQLRDRALWAGIAVMVAIIIYLAYTFRRVSKPVASWKYGTAAIIALFHDIVITLGVLSLLGHVWGVEMDVPIVVALLTILGYSVNDSIVVFDRVRENLIKYGSARGFAETVNIGVNQTLLRSLITGFGTLLVLVSMFFYGGETIKFFSFTLIIGIIFGTYSSIFVASPILVEWHEYSKRKM